MNSSTSPTASIGANPRDTKDSIINRKKELKGLSSSFSSNLGRRISPPQSRKTSDSTTSHNRSVKSIVAWLESSTGSNADGSSSSKHSGEELKTDVSLGSVSSAGLTSQCSRQTLHSALDVEEYSLTLLKYKKYFTERPLGRCLDGRPSSTSSSGELVEASRTEDIRARETGESHRSPNSPKGQASPAIQFIRREHEDVMAF
ncbi:hypothetical protein PT974_11397 [Cladobotryum mycophilum]|uniref:Uncharacterized protein n=1 Tax=Cladobotryum mycophilum TaxID=491253 RepID=A0ABR0S536_9HYPO